MLRKMVLDYEDGEPGEKIHGEWRRKWSIENKSDSKGGNFSDPAKMIKEAQLPHSAQLTK